MRALFRILSVSTLFCLPASSATASTLTFDFSFAGSGANGSGTLITSTTSTAGEYLITGISGTANGSAITGLLAPGAFPADYPPANDNLLFSPAVNGGLLDDAGFSFVDATGLDFNLFYGPNGGFDTSTAYQFVTGVGTSSNGGALTSCSAAATTPEPSSLALLGTGALGVAGVMRRRLA